MVVLATTLTKPQCQQKFQQAGTETEKRSRNIFGKVFSRGRFSYLISPQQLGCPPGKPSSSLHRKLAWNAQEYSSLFLCPFGNRMPLNKTSLTPVFSNGWLSGCFRGLKIESLIHFYFAARIAIDFAEVYCAMKRGCRETVSRYLTKTYQRESTFAENSLNQAISGWLRQCLKVLPHFPLQWC